jgi:riboflavin synthase
MFTGIIEATGEVESIGRVTPAAEVVRLVVKTQLDLSTMALGASIAVDGACLTIVEKGDSRFSADLGPETLGLTTLGTVEPGHRVHLERPLRLGDPLGGHLVAGHVDGVGTLIEARARGEALELDIVAPPEVARTLTPKGSIAVDGVSLTINAVAGDRFSVTLIPHTLSVTKLGEKKEGARVNLEADLIAKQLERLMMPYLDLGGDRTSVHTPRREMSVEVLRRYGLVR